MRVPFLTAAVLVACGGEPPSVSLQDAPVPDGQGPTFSCWPSIPPVVGPTAILGAAADDGSYMDMPEELPVAYGIQAGYMVIAHVRMSGITPGNPADILDPSNPFTRIRAFFDDTDIPLNPLAMCGSRFAYKETPNGYELPFSMPVPFDTCWRYDNLVGARLRVELEIMDRDGNYAKQTKVITGGPPRGTPGVDYPDEAGMGPADCTPEAPRRLLQGPSTRG